MTTATLRGAQRPRHLLLPDGVVSSAGAEAVELSAAAGLPLDPWQQFILDGALGETAVGKWAAFEVGVIVPRQNGKGGGIEARELAGLFLFGEELILHSAHEFKTAVEAFRRIRYLVENCPELYKRVAKIPTSHGDEGIELKPLPTTIFGSGVRRVIRGRAPRLRFVARTGGSGRGFSGDCIFLDEAFNLPEFVIAALMPTLSARKNPQIWYLSSAVDREIHPHGVTLAKVRERAHAGADPSLAYFEWTADPLAYSLDPEGTARDPVQQAAANPAVGIRISLEHIARECRAMGAVSKSFAVERLGLGDWPDTDPQGSQLVDPERWAALIDAGSRIVGPIVLAVDATPERSFGAIAVAGARADGLAHGELIEHRSGVQWMVPRLVELCAKHGPLSVVLDPSSAAGSLLSGLQEAGIEPDLVSGREMAQACGAFFDSVMEQGGDVRPLRHLGQPQVAAALAGAKKRDVGDAWAWARKSSAVDISPLVAVTLALHGHSKHAGVGAPNLWL